MEVPQTYLSRPAVIFATGPSLNKQQVEMVWPYVLRGDVVAFGVNDAYKIVPYLDVIYACDPGWWDYHTNPAHGNDAWVLDYLTGNKSHGFWTQDEGSAKKYGLCHIPGSGNSGLYDKDRTHIHFGSNSGFQVINLALHFGISEMLLLGYNMQSVNGERHFFGEHPKGLSRGSNYQRFCSEYDAIQKPYRSRIVNCTENTALTAFRKGELKDELSRLVS